MATTKKLSTKKEEKSEKEKKVNVAARVDEDALENCQEIADRREWSMSQVINKAMRAYRDQ